jgi:hypothetical protein
MQLAGPSGAAEAAELAIMIGTLPRAMLGALLQQREAVRSALETLIQSHDGPQDIVLPGALWVVGARVNQHRTGTPPPIPYKRLI